MRKTGRRVHPITDRKPARPSQRHDAITPTSPFGHLALFFCPVVLEQLGAAAARLGQHAAQRADHVQVCWLRASDIRTGDQKAKNQAG